ncbi:MAG: hypothetical protein HOY79_04330 [Streptomyces sp.]|nr:hypothetical protein [Streptomyces sp.]NUS15432.1 hypothetical protein [Streptomyces sp.]NUS24110.1 hypothetical protein [Streptomyces sp.]
MTPAEDSTIQDLRRELEKAREALGAASTHLARHAEMNASLHCAATVMYSPLHAKVTAAIRGIDQVLDRTEAEAISNGQNNDGIWAALAADLDRCQHGRHVGDPCGSCGVNSHGNPHMVIGDIVGYDVYGRHIVMPDRDHKHDPAAWRPQHTQDVA